MGKGGGSAPSPPDPAATAAAQAAANKEAVHESAKVNQINEVTPLGVLTYTGELGGPDRTRTTIYNPTVQGTLDEQQQLALELSKFARNPVFGNVQANFANPLNYEGIIPLPGEADLNAGASAVERATYNRAADLYRPEFERQTRQTQGDLVNRGLYQGSEAYDKDLTRLQDTQNRAYTGAADAAVLAGRQERSRMLAEALTGRQQGITERERLRATPLNELSALLQGAPATNVPQFAPAAQYNVQPADYTGAANMAYAGQMNQYNQNQAAKNAAMGGLYGLAGSLGGAGIMKWG